MYGKLFSSMYEGTLYGQWQAIVTFQQLIVLANQDGEVDMTPPAIAAKTSIPLEIIESGIEALMQSDKYSRSPAEAGKRIVLLDPTRPWGWRIVNYRYYRNLANAEDKRKKDRERIADKRKKASKNNSVAECRDMSQSVADVAHTNANAKVNAKKNTTAGKPAHPLEFEQTWKAYPSRAGGNPKSRAFKSWNARIREGVDPKEIHAGVLRYAKFCEATGKVGTEFVKQAATFFSQDGAYTEAWEPPREARQSGVPAWL